MAFRRSGTGPWGTLTAALAAQTAVSVVEQGIPTLTPFIKQDLAVSAGLAGLVVSLFTVGKVVAFYQAGRAVDRVGERLVLVVGALGTGLLAAAATVLPLAGLLVLLVCAGLFAATATPAGGKLVLVAFPRRQRGFALGLRQTGIPLGGLAAAALLPWLAHAFGWRASLAAAGGIAALGALAVITLAGVDTRQEREAARAAAVSEPWTALARDRDIVLATVWACLLVGGQYAIVAFLALDVHEEAGTPLTTAALLVVVAQVGGIVGRIGWGLVSDRLFGGRRRPLLVGITAVGIVVAALLAALPGHAPFAVLAVAAFAAGLSLIGWQGTWVTAVSELAGPARVGAVTGFGLTFVALAIAASPPLYGLVADLAGGFRATWIVLAAVLALALLPALALREPEPPAEPGKLESV